MMQFQYPEQVLEVAKRALSPARDSADLEVNRPTRPLGLPKSWARHSDNNKWQHNLTLVITPLQFGSPSTVTVQGAIVSPEDTGTGRLSICM